MICLLTHQHSETYGDDKSKLIKDVPNYFYAKSTATSNLRRHLRLIHPEDYDQAVVENKWAYPLSTQTNVASAHKDRTLRDPNLPPFSPSSFMEHLVRFIVADDQVSLFTSYPLLSHHVYISRSVLSNAPSSDSC